MATTTRTSKPSTLDRDTRDLYSALNDLVRLYQFRDRNMICCHDISVTQCYALQSLTRGGAMMLNALASDLMLDKSTASRVDVKRAAIGVVRDLARLAAGRIGRQAACCAPEADCA